MSQVVLTQVTDKPEPPGGSRTSIYVKTDKVPYYQDATGNQLPLGSLKPVVFDYDLVIPDNTTFIQAGDLQVEGDLYIGDGAIVMVL